MKKIILYRGKTIDCDIFKPTNYSSFFDDYKISGGNVGNKLFNTATEKYITNPYTNYKYVMYDEINFIPFINKEDVEEANSNYDLVIMPQANIFCNSSFHKNLLTMWKKGIEQFKIPVYVLGVGIQINKIEDINDLVESIHREATEFITAVYRTGGNFSLRGNYTKLFFEKLGFSEAIVTGCPSMFQFGTNLHLPIEKIPTNKFKPVINGFHSLFYKKEFSKIFDNYSNAVYLDQDEASTLLYNKSYFTENTKKQILQNYTPKEIELIAKNRFHLFYDLKTRFDFLKEEEFNFSFGPRIHGNIMAILNNIPGFVYAIDLRTQELAEYFEIPYITKLQNNMDLYELYYNANYEKFNKNYLSKYKKFENFLINNNIISEPLEKYINIFDEKFQNIQWQKPKIINQEKIIELNNEISKNFLLNTMYSKYIYYYKKIIKRIIK